MRFTRLLSVALPGLVAFGVGQATATPAAAATNAPASHAAAGAAPRSGPSKGSPGKHRWTISHGTTAADKVFAKLMRSAGNPDHKLYARGTIAELAKLGKAVCAVIKADGGDEAQALMDIDEVSGDPYTPEGNSWLLVASEVVYCPDQE